MFLKFIRVVHLFSLLGGIPLYGRSSLCICRSADGDLGGFQFEALQEQSCLEYLRHVAGHKHSFLLVSC